MRVEGVTPVDAWVFSASRSVRALILTIRRVWILCKCNADWRSKYQTDGSDAMVKPQLRRQITSADGCQLHQPPVCLDVKLGKHWRFCMFATTARRSYGRMSSPAVTAPYTRAVVNAMRKLYVPAAGFNTRAEGPVLT